MRWVKIDIVISYDKKVRVIFYKTKTKERCRLKCASITIQKNLKKYNNSGFLLPLALWS